MLTPLIYLNRKFENQIPCLGIFEIVEFDFQLTIQSEWRSTTHQMPHSSISAEQGQA
jgi:hypothetical protein